MILQKILADHKKWLKDSTTGRRANLEGANLEGANFKGADLTLAFLKGATLEGANLKYANLEDANLKGADLRDADLRGANLTEADLTGANLTGAILDFASWPLWCGSFDVLVDDRLMEQFVAHLARVKPQGSKGKAIQEAIAPWANDFREHQKIREV